MLAPDSGSDSEAERTRRGGKGRKPLQVRSAQIVDFFRPLGEPQQETRGTPGTRDEGCESERSDDVDDVADDPLDGDEDEDEDDVEVDDEDEDSNFTARDAAETEWSEDEDEDQEQDNDTQPPTPRIEEAATPPPEAEVLRHISQFANSSSSSSSSESEGGSPLVCKRRRLVHCESGSGDDDNDNDDEKGKESPVRRRKLVPMTSDGSLSERTETEPREEIKLVVYHSPPRSPRCLRQQQRDARWRRDRQGIDLDAYEKDFVVDDDEEVEVEQEEEESVHHALHRKHKKKTHVLRHLTEYEEHEDEDDEDGDEDVFDPNEALDGVLQKCEDCADCLCKYITAHKGSAPQAAPALLAGTLHPHQLEGISWLYLVHSFDMNAILADEMGLGKTVQALAFLVLLQQHGVEGPHLVVVPASTLENWKRELEAWCPTFSVLVYYGTQREREEIRSRVSPHVLQYRPPPPPPPPQGTAGAGAGAEGETTTTTTTEEGPAYNVVLTTYTVAVAKRDRAFLRKCRFCYFVVDEAHNLKNAGSKRYEALLTTPCAHRLLLTGTPLQNNLKELWALLQFLLPDIIPTRSRDDRGLLRELFRGSQDASIARLKAIVRPFLLRRLKSQVALPVSAVAKTRTTVACPMAPRQHALYAALLSRSKARWALHAPVDTPPLPPSSASDDTLWDESSSSSHDGSSNSSSKSNSKDSGSGNNNRELSSLMNNIIMQLRKTANHPLLLRALYTDARVAEMAAALVAHGGADPADQRFVGITAAQLGAVLQEWSDYELHTLCCEKARVLGAHALPESAFFEAGKVQRLCALVAAQQAQTPPHKVLVFSQMTRMLDILEHVVRARGWSHLRLDGSTPVAARQTLVDTFNSDPVGAPVFPPSSSSSHCCVSFHCLLSFPLSFPEHRAVPAIDQGRRAGPQPDERDDGGLLRRVVQPAGRQAGRGPLPPHRPAPRRHRLPSPQRRLDRHLFASASPHTHTLVLFGWDSRHDDAQTWKSWQRKRRG